MVDGIPIGRALADLRQCVGRSGMYGSQVRDLKGMMTLAGMRSISYPDGHPAETAYTLAAWIVADEVGLLTGHQRIAMRKSLSDVGLLSLLEREQAQ